MIYLRSSVGIEIRGQNLILSSLQGNLSGVSVTGIQSVANFRHRTREEVLAEIEAFFKSRGLARDNIVLGIPRRDLIIRHLDLPAEVADNIKQVVLYQVQSYAPTEEEKFYYDYSILQNVQKSKRLLILVAMVRKTALDDYLSILSGFGIRPVTVTGSSLALAGLLLQHRKDSRDKTFFLADLTSESMEIVALRNGALLYSHEVAQVEIPVRKECLLREIEVAAGKIRLGQGDSIEKILLAGEGAGNIRRQIGEDMTDCGLIEREIGFSVPQEIKPRLESAVSSVGLAFLGMVRRAPLKINLLPPQLRNRRNRLAYATAAVLALVIFGLLAALSFREMAQERILGGKHGIGALIVCLVILAEDQSHDQTDADAKRQREEQAGESQVRADHPTGVDQRQDIGRRREEQEGDCRPNPGAFLVDPGEERNDGAGAHCQHRAGQGRRRVRDHLGRVAPQEARDGVLGDQGGHRPRDVEGGQEAQQHMCSQVGCQVARAALK